MWETGKAMAVAVAIGCLIPATAALAQPARPAAAACAAVGEVAIPADLRSWIAKKPLTAATGGDGPAIAIGRAYTVGLHPDARLDLPNLPGPRKDRVGRGGTMHFDVASPGRYHVALGSGVWVDVVRDGKALASVAHGHGPECSGITKIVDFDLEAGRHVLTLDGSETEATAVLVAPAARR